MVKGLPTCSRAPWRKHSVGGSKPGDGSVKPGTRRAATLACAWSTVSADTGAPGKAGDHLGALALALTPLINNSVLVINRRQRSPKINSGELHLTRRRTPNDQAPLPRPSDSASSAAW
jgi:hypothetical protein